MIRFQSVLHPYLKEIGAFEAGATRHRDRDVPEEVVDRIVTAFKNGKGVQTLSKELAADRTEPYGADWTRGRVSRLVRKELGVTSISDLRSDYPLERQSREGRPSES